MKGHFHFPAAALLGLVLLASTSAASAQQSGGIVVPAQVVELVRPVLDEVLTHPAGSGVGHDPPRKQFYALVKKQGRFADEALVVLLCFDVMGESQEETDAVIARGRKMLPYLKRYRRGNPVIAGQTYPDTMLKSYSHKQEDFEGATKAIQHGWRGTWDNPEG
jgi:hypothetical protein